MKKTKKTENPPIKDLDVKGESVKGGWSAEGMGKGALAAADVYWNTAKKVELVLGEATLEK